nr:VanZ family protein [Flavobacterium selenitireducens]
MCLVSFNDLPKVSVGNVDKYVHGSFHFLFTLLWYLYLRTEGSMAGTAQILFKVVAASAVFGIAIEFAQGALTATRQADVNDALANIAGALLAAVCVMIYKKMAAQTGRR